jgi:hypothetical protein
MPQKRTSQPNAAAGAVSHLPLQSISSTPRMITPGILQFATGILAENVKIDHNLSTFDTTACSTFTEIIATNPAKPYVITARMMFNNSKVASIEVIVTANGDLAFKLVSFIAPSTVFRSLKQTPISQV